VELVCWGGHRSGSAGGSLWCLLEVVGWAHEAVMGRGMVLDKVVSEVLVGSFLPMDTVLALTDSVTDPIIVHVDGAGAMLFDSIVDNTIGGGIVSLHRGGWLWPAHFVECGVEWAGLGSVPDGRTVV
jgi:hypothetical protein